MSNTTEDNWQMHGTVGYVPQITTGSQNVFLGYKAGYAVMPTGSNQVLFGAPRCQYCNTISTSATHCVSCGAPR